MRTPADSTRTSMSIGAMHPAERLPCQPGHLVCAMARFGLCLMLTLPGCSGSTGWSDMAQNESEEFPIQWERGATHGGPTYPARLAIRSRPQMAYCPIADVPVDFNTQMVLVAAMGRVMSDQYAIRIQRVWREGSLIKVDIAIRRPSPEAKPPMKLVCPYHVVVVPRSDLNVEDFTLEPRMPKPGAASPLFGM